MFSGGASGAVGSEWYYRGSSFARRAMYPLLFGAVTMSLSGCADGSAPLAPQDAVHAPKVKYSTSRAGDLISDQYIVTLRGDVSDVPGTAKRLIAQANGQFCNSSSFINVRSAIIV
ncbi:MAG: hypothetical protein ABI681_13380 [Gemmatimonadales bacterium]